MRKRQKKKILKKMNKVQWDLFLLKQFEIPLTWSFKRLPDLEMVEYDDPCAGCSNHPRNGGSGFCHCTIPYMSKTQPYTSSNRLTITTTGTGISQ
jgi:hypothetical protein